MCDKMCVLSTYMRFPPVFFPVFLFIAFFSAYKYGRGYCPEGFQTITSYCPESLSNVRRCWLAMPLGACFLSRVLACHTIERKTENLKKNRAKKFRQIKFYLPEQFRQITSSFS